MQKFPGGYDPQRQYEQWAARQRRPPPPLRLETKPDPVLFWTGVGIIGTLFLSIECLLVYAFVEAACR